MRRTIRTDDLAFLRAHAVDDVIAVCVLVALGIPESTVYRRCRARGPWQLLAPGVVLLSTGTPTRRQRLRAALLHGGPGAVVTGLDAARAHGLRRGELPEYVHVLIPGTRQVRSVRDIVVERTGRLTPNPLIRDDLPVASLERCVLDAVRRLRDESDIAAILTEPVQRRMVLKETLEDELEQGCRKGSATPRKVLRGIRGGVRSAAEFDVRTWWLSQPELDPEVLFDVALFDDHGAFLGIADVYDEEIGLVVPVDSVEQHFATPEQVALDGPGHVASGCGRPCLIRRRRSGFPATGCQQRRSACTKGLENSQRRANDDTRRPTIVRAFRQPLDATLGRSVVGVRITRRIS
jgi:hypothetical protein